MKKIRRFILTVFAVCLFGGTAFAEPTPEVTVSYVQGTGLDRDGVTLRVGYVPNTGFIYEDFPGHKCGYGYEYMEFLANYMHCRFEYVPSYSWVECGEKLNSGEIDILPAMPGYYKVIPNYARTDHVIGRFPMELVIGKGGVKEQMKIGTLPTNYPTPNFQHIAEGEGFTYELINFPLHYDMEEALKAGKIDGYIDAMLNPREAKAYSLFDRQSYRALVRADRKDLLAKMNLAMDQMLLYQPNIRDFLNNKYLRIDGFPLLLSRGERNFLQNKKQLTAVIFVWQRPYAYMENGEPKGVFVDIVRRIESDLGVKIELLQTETLQEATDALQMGRADFAVDTICDFSWAHDLKLNPTQPFFIFEYVMVKRRGEMFGSDSKIAAPSMLLYTQTFLEPTYSKERLIYFDNLSECFEAVADGRADAVFSPRTEVQYIMEETGTYNLEAMPESDYTERFSLGVSKVADTNLWMILNKEINHLDSKWVRNLLNVNEQENHAFSPRWFVYHYPFQAVMIAMAVTLLLGGAFWYKERMKKEHLAVVQHMAYTDMRYDLPNMAWLEKEAPVLIERQTDNYRAGMLYVVVFIIESKSSTVIEYGKELLYNQLKRMARHLDKKDWVLMTAAGIDIGNLVCVCIGKDNDAIQKMVAEAVNKYSYIKTPDSKIKLHTTAGICAIKSDGVSVRQTIDRATAAARECTDIVRIFDGALEEQLHLQQQIESSMEKALEMGEFHAWYQPKYDIKTKKIIGAEALVRWISHDMGFMPPGKFIPLFEANGFVIPVDYCLLEQAFTLQKERLAAGKEVVPISVNQSRLHITEEGYLDKMRAIVDKYRLPKGLIELELTETVFGDFDQREYQKHAANIIHELHDMGFSISIDDFGSGYSSFTMLNFLPLDVMKIDRSLLVASDDSQRMRDILGNVIRMGKTLNMQIICEGIETKEQEDLLLELGCHLGQGYLNAKPMPVDEFIAFMEERNRKVAAGEV